MVDPAPDVSPQPNISPQLEPSHHFHRRGVAGIALILTGIFALIAVFTSADLFGLLFLPAIGLIFLAWGIATRHARPIVPGGILLGIGIGVLLAHFFTAAGFHEGIFLLCTGLGFLIITPLSRMYTTKTELWPLIPGVILAALSIVFFVGGTALATVEIIGKFWPVVLIVIGAYLLWEWNRQSKRQ